MQPGITGLAQINLPPDSDLESVRRKLVLDLEYIAEANPSLDFRMFVWSGLRLIGFSSSSASKLLGLERNLEPVEVTHAAPVSVAELFSPNIDFNGDRNDKKMPSGSSRGNSEQPV